MIPKLPRNRFVLEGSKKIGLGLTKLIGKIAEVQLDLFPLIKVTLIRASFLLYLSLRFTGNQSENENAQQGF